MAAFLSEEKIKMPNRISLKYFPTRRIGNKPALVQVKAWRRTGDRPLPEPILTQFRDA